MLDLVGSHGSAIRLALPLFDPQSVLAAGLTVGVQGPGKIFLPCDPWQDAVIVQHTLTRGVHQGLSYTSLHFHTLTNNHTVGNHTTHTPDGT